MFEIGRFRFCPEGAVRFGSRNGLSWVENGPCDLATAYFNGWKTSSPRYTCDREAVSEPFHEGRRERPRIARDRNR